MINTKCTNAPTDAGNIIQKPPSVLLLLTRTSGWRIRVLTRFGPQAGPTGKEVKDVWGLDDRTTIIIVDPTSPNVLAFNTGRSVEQLLSRSFFIELQSRYGNKFFVRDEASIFAACLISNVYRLAMYVHEC